MNITTRSFGVLEDGTEIDLITATGEGLEISVMPYGATLVSATFPDKDGNRSELMLGFDSLAPYEGKHPYFGATVGRYANRIGGASFELGGTRYSLAKNDGENALHGGIRGFNRVVWNVETEAENDVAKIIFTYRSPSGEEGYPGNLDVTMTYIVTDRTLTFDYHAVSDADTPVNLTNHSYWNLGVHGGDILDHILELNSDSYLATDEGLIPDGTILEVEGNAFDFTCPKRIGKDIAAAGGYDTNFIISGKPGTMRVAAVLECPLSGRRMTVRTDQAAMQVYSGNKLTGLPGRDGCIYGKHAGLCLETGGYNNSVNIRSFPSTVLKAGAIYRHTTEHLFEIGEV